MAFQNSLALFFVICFTLSYIFGPTVGSKITHPCLGKAVHSKTNHKMIQFLAKTAKKHHVFQPMLTALLLMHDVEANPGPTKFPCGTCEMAVRSNHQAICCDQCSHWFHIACQGMSKATYNRLPCQEFAWSCNTCTLNVYNSSFFQSTIEVSQTPSSPSQPGSPQFHSTPQKGRQTVNVTQPLLLLNVNCQSIIAKKAEFQELIDTHNPDIVCATETWLAGHHCDGEIGDPLSFINNYEVHRRDRTNRQGGGVFVAVRKDLKSSRQIEIETDCEIVWVKLEIPNCPNVYICSYYRPNVSDTDSNIALTTSLERLPRNCSTYIAGDFNYPGIKWPEATIQPSTPYYNLHADFIDTLHDHGLEQVVTQRTREDNTLDLLITNNPSSCKNVTVKPGISDHEIVLTLLPCPIKSRPTSGDSHDRLPPGVPISS